MYGLEIVGAKVQIWSHNCTWVSHETVSYKNLDQAQLSADLGQNCAYIWNLYFKTCPRVMLQEIYHLGSSPMGLKIVLPPWLDTTKFCTTLRLGVVSLLVDHCILQASNHKTCVFCCDFHILHILVRVTRLKYQSWTEVECFNWDRKLVIVHVSPKHESHAWLCGLNLHNFTPIHVHHEVLPTLTTLALFLICMSDDQTSYTGGVMPFVGIATIIVENSQDISFLFFLTPQSKINNFVW